MIDPGQRASWSQEGPEAGGDPFCMDGMPVGVTGEDGLIALSGFDQVLKFESQKTALGEQDMWMTFGTRSLLKGAEQGRAREDSITVGVGDQEGCGG
jgi:hypothetical protein